MASPGSDANWHLHLQHQLTEADTEPAVREVRKWIEAVTGRGFGEKDFRRGLDNGILLCELLSCIKPCLVKKINRLPTPLAGLDNVTLFLKGCKELGLKGSQLFDLGDLQDTCTNNKGSDCNKRLRNVLITIYWLGRAANSSATYNGPTLDLREFEGFISQIRKEAEDCDSPKRNIRDSGYIDCWESERSNSLSPPRHARDDSFDSLDSIGSRSRHTPSPEGLFARGSSDGRGSDSECDFPFRRLPDVRRDDMLARRTSCSEPRTAMPFNQYLPNKSNQTTYVPIPLRKQRTDREESCKSWSSASSPVGGDRPFSSSPVRSHVEDLPRSSLTTSSMTTSNIVTRPLSPLSESGLGPLPSPITVKEGWVSPSRNSPKRSSPCPTHFLDAPESDNQTRHTGTEPEKEIKKLHRRPSSLDKDLSPTFCRRDSVFDDPESMSMTDMRVEEDGMLTPHSQIRHELMHGQYHRLKEEESQWQDDLAKWKNRRRSVSQDLIKKEEERKTMERLMSFDEETQRRKSVKTYREIVEDKERRERDLHEAYLKARTPAEAAAVLQRYAQRYTISEIVLEHLKLPRVLERSVSVDPTRLSSSPTNSLSSPSSSNPLHYLRQQSLPTPKFTATVEANLTEYGVEQGIAGNEGKSLGAARLGRSLPLFGPKPFGHDRASKRETMNHVNGGTDKTYNKQNLEMERRSEEKGERKSEEDSSSLIFYPSTNQNIDVDNTEMPISDTETSDKHLTCTLDSEQLERADSELVLKQNVVSGQSQKEEDAQKEVSSNQSAFLPMLPNEEDEVLQTRGMSLPIKQETPKTEVLLEKEFAEKQLDVTVSTTASQNNILQTEQVTHTLSQNYTAPELLSKPVLELSEETASQLDQFSLDQSGSNSAIGHPVTELANSVQLAPLSSNSKLRLDFFTSSEPVNKQHGNVAPVVLNLVKRGEHFSWDPVEEHKRQKRWQQEQERMLQEKYHREQDRLKHEWDMAQKEVEEEERKYHEEERKILEETVTPLTPHSPLTPSPCWEEPGSLNSTDTQHTDIRSLVDWECKQKELNKQMNESWESKKQSKNEMKDPIRTKEEPFQTPERSVQLKSSKQLSCEQLLDLSNGHREGAGLRNQDPDQLQTSQEVSWSSKQSSESWQKTVSLDCTKKSQAAPGGRRRSGSIESADTKSSQSISFTDTQPPPSPNRSVSGKKLCSSCGHPLGKGAAMIIETLCLYFHIQCFRCGICKGQLGDTTTGTDVRIRNGLLNCHQCYIRSRSAGQPTNL